MKLELKKVTKPNGDVFFKLFKDDSCVLDSTIYAGNEKDIEIIEKAKNEALMALGRYILNNGDYVETIKTIEL